ncbi:universal stress protein [Chloroflexota bacterium]
MEFKNILVPVAGTEADEGAMQLACRLSKREKAKMWSVYVVTIKRSLPLEAEIASEITIAEGILDHIENIAEEENCEVETDILQAREAGPAIIDEAIERNINLILMGIKYKSRFGQYSLGDVVPYVLKHSPCPVMLYHQ